MADEVTKVVYDVSQAVKELNKLNEVVDKSGKKAQEGFGKAGGAVDRLTGRLSNMNPVAGRAVGSLRNIAGVGGAAGVALGGVGAAAALLAQQLFDIPSLLRDTNEQLDNLKNSGRAAQNLEDAASAIGDAFVNREFRDRRQALRAENAALTEKQNEVDIARESAKERLDVERNVLRSINQAVRESTKERFDAERALKDKLNSLAADGSIGNGSPAARRQAVVDLSNQAQQAAAGGDTERAEELLNKAKELSAELGNHFFFTSRIAEADKAIVTQLEEQVKKTREAQAAQAAKQAAAAKSVASADQELDRQTQISREIQRQRRTLGADRQQLGNDREAAADLQTAEQAVRDFQTLREEINRTRESGRSFGEDLKIAFSIIKDASTKNGPELRRLVESFGNLDTSAIQQNINAGTGESLQRATEQAARLTDLLANLKVNPNFPIDTLGIDVARIESILESVQRGSAAGIRAGQSGIGQDENIEAGAARLKQEQQGRRLQQLLDESGTSATTLNQQSNEFAGNLERAAAASNTISSNLANTSFGNAPAASATQPASQQVAAPTAAAPGPSATQVVNVNATVKGGLIDREVTEQITDIIRRELRKQTANAQTA